GAAFLEDRAAKRQPVRIGPTGPCLRAPDRAFFERRGKSRGRVLHPASGRAAYGRDPPAARGHANMRSSLRVRGPADRVRRVRQSPGREPAEPISLRPGEEPSHLDSLQDESVVARASGCTNRKGGLHSGPETLRARRTDVL